MLCRSRRCLAAGWISSTRRLPRWTLPATGSSTPKIWNAATTLRNIPSSRPANGRENAFSRSSSTLFSWEKRTTWYVHCRTFDFAFYGVQRLMQYDNCSFYCRNQREGLFSYNIIKKSKHCKVVSIYVAYRQWYIAYRIAPLPSWWVTFKTRRFQLLQTF